MVNSLKIGLLAALVLDVAVSAPVFATPTSSVAAVPLAAPAPAVAGDPTLTFSEFPVGTIITTQYAPQGVLFAGLLAGPPIIANDGAMPNSPVLSPNPPFAGTFQWMFPSGASGVQFDSGFWDSLGTGVIDVFNTSNVLVAALTNTNLGVDHFDLSSFGVIGRVTFNSTADPAGADIDNLQFQVPVPEPMSFVLLGTGLAVLGLIRRRKAA